MAECDESLNALVVQKICTLLGIEQIKEFQYKVLYEVGVRRKDCVVCVPTGSGKSLCYEGLPLVVEQTPGTSVHHSVHSACSDVDRTVILIVSPLISLIKAQVEHLRERGFTAINIVGNLEKEEKDSLEQGRFRYLVGNPESFLGSSYMGTLLKSDLYQKKVSCLVFDEVHTAVAWGLSSNTKPAFRRYFAEVGDLRAKLSDVPMLALTATASKTTLTTIKQMLSMRDPFQYIESPDRTNIRIYIKRVSSDIEIMDWLVEGLQKYDVYPKTIVYCRSITDCSKLYQLFDRSLGPNPLDLSERSFDMIHSKTPADVKEALLSHLMNDKSKLRIVIATKILGMGLDIRCSQVVHYGPPGSVDDFLQQIGRAGRDGQQSHSVLLYHGKQLRNLDSCLTRVLKSEEVCLRGLLLEDFDGERRTTPGHHLCCTYCAATCKCGECNRDLNEYEKYILNSEVYDNDVEKPTRAVADSEKQKLKLDLLELKRELDNSLTSEQSLYASPYLIHGLSEYVISNLLSKSNMIFSLDDIIDTCISVYSTACLVLNVFSSVFYDMDKDKQVDQDDYLPCNT